MQTVIGLNAKLYYGTAGQTAAAELNIVKDVTITMETEEADITARASGGWKNTVPFLKSAAVEFEMIYDPSDAGFTALRNAYWNGTYISLFVSDGSGNGLSCDAGVYSMRIRQRLENVITAEFVCKTAVIGTPPRLPSWVAAPAPQT